MTGACALTSHFGLLVVGRPRCVGVLKVNEPAEHGRMSGPLARESGLASRGWSGRIRAKTGRGETLASRPHFWANGGHRRKGARLVTVGL